LPTGTEKPSASPMQAGETWQGRRKPRSGRWGLGIRLDDLSPGSVRHRSCPFRGRRRCSRSFCTAIVTRKHFAARLRQMVADSMARAQRSPAASAQVSAAAFARIPCDAALLVSPGARYGADGDQVG
jgi:hypothetical protein